MTSAEEPKPNWDQIKKDAQAEKEAVEEQRKLLEARKSLEGLQSPADPSKKAIEDQVAAANAAKALAEAEKFAAEAKKAQADASLAALKAQIGDIPASGYTGNVDLKSNAGEVEAALLSAKAMDLVAGKIAEIIGPKRLTNKTVLLYSASEIPNFQSLLSFRAQMAIIQNAFAHSGEVSNDAETEAPDVDGIKKEAVPIVAAAGLALDALNKAIGFFRTDYTVGGISVTLEDSMLVNSLAGTLVANYENMKVRLPGIYNAQAVSSTFETGIGKQLTDMAMLKAGFQVKATQHEKVSAAYAEQAGKETDTKKKDKLLKNAATRKAAAEAVKAGISVYDAFFTKLVTTDDKGTVALTNVIREESLANALKANGLLLFVKVHKSGGAYYTKKNLWTFFGGMPFYHMGGTVGSFVLIDGIEGDVLASGVVPIHGGFVNADKLGTNVNGANAVVSPEN